MVSKRGLGTTSSSLAWELVRNANVQTSLQTAEWGPLGAGPSQLQVDKLLGDSGAPLTGLQITDTDISMRNTFWIPQQVTLSVHRIVVKKGGFGIRQL